MKLFHSGATVERELVVTSQDGRLPVEIEVAELPLALLDASVRVRVRALDPEASSLVAADLRIGLSVPVKERPPEPPDLAALRAVEERISEKREEERILEDEMSLLGSMTVPDRPRSEEGKPPPASPLGARIALEEFIDEASKTRRQQQRALRIEREKLEEEAAAIRDRIARSSDALRVKAQELSKTVIVRLRQGAEPISRAVLRLEYFVPGARWAPAYQCRLSRDGSTAEIQQRALVCQRSGEDWRGVKLTLSTASPLRWAELPELTEIRIGKAQADLQTKRGFRPPPIGAERLYSDFDRDRAAASGRLPSRAPWSPPVLQLEPPRPMVLLASGRDAPPPSDLVEEESTGEYARIGGGGAAMQARASMMMLDEVAAAPAMEMMDREEGYAARKPMPAPAAPPPAMRSAAGPAPAAKKMKRREAQAEIGLSEPEPSSQEAMLYTQLQLPPPDQPLRGKLAPIDSRQEYLSILRRKLPSAGEEALSIVRNAELAAAGAASIPLPRDAINVRQESGAFDFVYEADAVVDVPSDGAWHSIALTSRAVPSEVRYVVVPRIEPHVYRTAHLTNASDAPLLSGTAEVYVGGEYVLTTVLPTVPAGGEVTLGLGVEQAIKCARNTRFIEKRSGSKVVATNDLWHEIEIELVNHLSRPAQTEVRERIPQPADDAEVVVEEGAVEPAWEEYTQEERGSILRGGRRWNVVVPAGGSLKLKARYAVKIYANNEVVGGNRRES